MSKKPNQFDRIALWNRVGVRFSIAIFCLLQWCSHQSARAAGLFDTNQTRTGVTFLLTEGNFSYLTTNEQLSPSSALKGHWESNQDRPYRDPKRHMNYWFRFTFKLDEAPPQDMVIFHNSNYIAEEMIIYRIQNGEAQHLGKTGSRYPNLERTFAYRILGAKAQVLPKDTVEFLIHVKTPRSFHPDFALSTYDFFTRRLQQQSFMLGSCVGVHMVIILLATIFAYRMRDRAYASFAMLSIVMLMTILTGFGFREVTDLTILSNVNSDVAMKLARPATLFFFLQLTRVFLTLGINSPRLDQWIQATMVSAMLLAMLSFSPEVSKFALDGGDRLIFIGMILSLIASFRCFRRGVPYSGYFSVAAAVLILSTLPLMINLVMGRSFSNLSLSLVPIGQSIEMIVLAMALIAKVRRIDEARVGAEVAANKSEELKTMLRVMSHDLNNPLTIITSYSQIGIKKSDQIGASELSKILEKIFKAAQNQHDIIEHIKQMRAVEDGKTELELAGVSLLDAIKQAESTFEHNLASKNIRLVYDPKDFQGLNVLAEKTSLNHTVLNNLISNAIKFSHPGGTIELKPETGPNTVKLVIKDFGVGMPDALAKNIFRSDKPTSRVGTDGETGTGFGMPVVKSYMNRFGGDIEIETKHQDQESNDIFLDEKRKSPRDHGTQVTLSFKKSA